MMGGLLEWLKRLFGFGKKEEPKPEPATPIPVPIDPVDPHEPPVPEPGAPIPPLPPIPAPAIPGESFAVDLRVNGQAIDVVKNEHGTVVPTQLVVKGQPGSRLTLSFEVDMEYVGDPALLAHLKDTQAFRDYAFIPGAAWLHLVSWPWLSNPVFQMGDPVATGVVVESGAKGGWARTQQNTVTQKRIYLANITEHALLFTIDVPVTVSRSSTVTYAVIKGFIDAAYGDDRKRNFEIWLNNIGADF
jgi:hypothetical protein